MLVNNTNIMPDASEIICYDDERLPLYIRRGILSKYPNMRAAAHWHEDLEFIRVEEGEMNYSVNGRSVHLDEGDCFLVNSRQIHFGFDEQKKECVFWCILIHPSLLCRDNALLGDILSPMLRDSSFPCLRFADERMGDLLLSVTRARLSGDPGYQFEAVGMLTQAVGQVLDVWSKRENANSSMYAVQDPQLDLQRRMVAFIEENFASEMTLDEIAGSANVSRSTCCRLFRKYVHTSPIEFLNSYRLQIACGQLESTDLSITDIALNCGFNHTSYFSQLFAESFGDTPREYRKKHDRQA